jgi:hypothetical protein
MKTVETQKERNLKALNDVAKGKWNNLQLCRPEQVARIDVCTEKSVYPERELDELEDDWGPELNDMDHWLIVFPGFDGKLTNPCYKTKGKFAVIGEEKLSFDTMKECFEWLVDKYDEIPFIDIRPRILSD